MYDYFHNMENKELAFDAEKHDAENDKLYEFGEHIFFCNHSHVAKRSYIRQRYEKVVALP